MVGKKDITIKTRKAKTLELARETQSSVIAVQRQYVLDTEFLDPKKIDEYYSTVPEIFRALNLRASAIIYRGYEVQENDNSKEAQDYAALCNSILEYSGGVNFIEQWYKNAEAYGNGYIELVEDGGKIVELVPVHAYNFGYELEEYVDKTDFKTKTRVKLDPNTKKPVGFASYKYDETKEVYVNDQLYPLENIVHLKFNVIGDAIYGTSLIQAMAGSISAKLKIENSIEAAAKMVAAPKMVIKGDFSNEEAARDQAREAASLDVNDVVILNNGEEFNFVNPGDINLPALREIFIVNITTASGIPRPLLTSESSEINKATMDTLLAQLRENMRSNMNRMSNIIKHQVFSRIGEKNGISDYMYMLPDFIFPEDPDTEQQIIVREEKKAATLTSLSNNLQILNNVMNTMGVGSATDTGSLKDKMLKLMESTIDTYQKTLSNFTINNDQDPSKQELDPEAYNKDTGVKPIKLDAFSIDPVEHNIMAERNDITDTTIMLPDNTESESWFSQYTLNDEQEYINNANYLVNRHNILHQVYDVVADGDRVMDSETGIDVSIPAIIAKHRFYIKKMQELGQFHEPVEIGEDLDYIYYD